MMQRETDKQFYSANDIMTILNVGHNTAYEIIHGFMARGQAVRINRTLRVRIDYFNAWLTEQESAGRMASVGQ